MVDHGSALQLVQQVVGVGWGVHGSLGMKGQLVWLCLLCVRVHTHV